LLLEFDVLEETGSCAYRKVIGGVTEIKARCKTIATAAGVGAGAGVGIIGSGSKTTAVCVTITTTTTASISISISSIRSSSSIVRVALASLNPILLEVLNAHSFVEVFSLHNLNARELKLILQRL
jgi:hypothetical protein